MKKINKTAFAIGTSIVAGLGSTTVIAANNPFESTELAAGYLNIAEAGVAADQGGMIKAKDGSCGEGKCGNKTDESKQKATEGKCGEGKCGDKKVDGSKAKEGKCGSKKVDESKAMEGKCGGKK